MNFHDLLLDVSAFALLWKTHAHHERVDTWQQGQKLAVCPLSELGFLRITTQPSFGLTVGQARTVLEAWRQKRCPESILDDLEALQSDPPTTGKRTTDFYLASLAAKHAMQLATLDGGIGHKAAFEIPA